MLFQSNWWFFPQLALEALQRPVYQPLNSAQTRPQPHPLQIREKNSHKILSYSLARNSLTPPHPTPSQKLLCIAPFLTTAFRPGCAKSTIPVKSISGRIHLFSFFRDRAPFPLLWGQSASQISALSRNKILRSLPVSTVSLLHQLVFNLMLPLGFTWRVEAVGFPKTHQSVGSLLGRWTSVPGTGQSISSAPSVALLHLSHTCRVLTSRRGVQEGKKIPRSQIKAVLGQAYSARFSWVFTASSDNEISVSDHQFSSWSYPGHVANGSPRSAPDSPWTQPRTQSG